MKKFLTAMTITFVLMLSGCASVKSTQKDSSSFNVIKQNSDVFNRSTYFTLNQSHLTDGERINYVKLGAYWNIKTSDLISLVIVNDLYMNNDKRTPVRVNAMSLNIDGDIRWYRASPMGMNGPNINDHLTQKIFPRGSLSIEMPMDEFKEVLETSDVRLRMHINSDQYEDAIFSLEEFKDEQKTAKYYLKKLLSEIEAFEKKR
ncbi:hypothetical protein [Pleionea sp. CnH1-48]|uniref:hypothetical protein n=1 Tax=Pleionea sp. CnH1-48 TaxID=2954494 RepID=UPI0020985633|nr:hypothetical protein [Pleionea sp. CnH1-48]MCO7227044.1 hypothetical protein [Pleionea sp. CnH1-48]